MKQSSSSSINASLQANYDMNDYEMEIAGILLQLPHLMIIRNRLPLSLPSWGTKRRRSTEENTSLRPVRLPSRSTSPATLPFSQEIGVVVCPAFQPEKPAAKVEEASSPATPLAFNPSESDEIHKPLKRKPSVKKRKEELLQMEEECTQSNEILRKRIEWTRNYLMSLQAQRLNLQKRKQELILGIRKGEAHAVKPASTNTVGPHHKNVRQLMLDERPSMMDRTANKLEKSERYEYQHGQAVSVSLLGSRRGMGMSKMINEKVGPSAVLDLNESPQTVSPIWMEFHHQVEDDHSRRIFTKAMAAQARQRRMLKCRDKIKNFNAIHKLRLPHK